MKLTLAFLTAIAASTPVLGFRIPANQPDGVYEVFEGANGEAVFTEIAKILSPSELSASDSSVGSRSSRIRSINGGLDQIYCFNQGAMDHADTDAANANLDAQIGPNGRGVGSHLSIYAKRGDAVAYCCNNRSQGNTCYQSVHHQADSLITTKCGAYQAGSAYDSGAHLTYGYELAAYNNFCPSG